MSLSTQRQTLPGSTWHIALNRLRMMDAWAVEHYWVLVPVLSVAAVLKQGFDIFAFDERTGGFDQVPPYIPAVPNYYRPWKELIGQHLPWLSFGALSYALIALGLLLAAIAVISVMCWATFSLRLRLVALTSLLLGSIGTVLFTLMGMYDTLFIVGSCLFVWARGGRKGLIVLGVTLMVWANPAQALAGSVCLLLLSLTPDFGHYRGRAITAACVAATLELGESFIPATGPLQEHVSFVRESISFTLQNAPLRFLTMYGVLIVLVALAVLASTRRDMLLRLVALILIPAAVVTITLDGTRVGVSTVACSAFALMLWVAPHLDRWLIRTGTPVVAIVFLVAVIPTPNALYNAVHVPWASVVSVIHGVSEGW